MPGIEPEGQLRIGENGELLDKDLGEYYIHLGVRETAKFRISTWLRYKPGSFLRTYLYLKPRALLNWPWYWEDTPLFPYAAVFVFGSFITMFLVRHGDSKPIPSKSVLERFDTDD